MNPGPPKPERRRRWLAPAALLAVAPKCVLCALTYAGLGSAFGLGGPELCGAPDASPASPLLLGILSAGGFLLHRTVNRFFPSRS